MPSGLRFVPASDLEYWAYRRPMNSPLGSAGIGPLTFKLANLMRQVYHRSKPLDFENA